jgi:hypothetical protein
VDIGGHDEDPIRYVQIEGCKPFSSPRSVRGLRGEKKRNVRAQGSADGLKLLVRNFQCPQFRESLQHGGRVRTPAAKPRAERNALLDVDFYADMNTSEVSQQVSGSHAKICGVISKPGLIGSEDYSFIVLQKLQLIIDVDQTKHGLDVVVSVWPLAKDMEPNINFCVCPDFHRE